MSNNKLLELKEYLEGDLFEFAKYINPQYSYGWIHEEVFRWLSSPEAFKKQLLLLPRGHLKSHCIAVWTVWTITKEPWCSLIYVSAGEELAKAQVYSIKNMLTCDEYRLVWPEMINVEEAKRDKWTAWSVNVDHPERKRRGVRDATLLVRTVKSNAAGLHCSHLVFDDIVVPNNAYTAAGRMEVRQAVSQFSSVLNPGGVVKAVGTVYHTKDIYADWKEATARVYNDSNELIGDRKVWEIMEREVESVGDMTGNYLWPRVHNPANKDWYGFDIHVLAEIRAQYESVGELAQFFAQYYNNANDPSSSRLDYSDFTYYDRKYLSQEAGSWRIGEKPLAIFASMDVAWTSSETSDYTAIAVVGVDHEGYIYVLDLDRFKTSDYYTYYNKVSRMHDYWGFKKLRIETNSGGRLVSNQLESFIREDGRSLTIEASYTSGHGGKKFERHAAILEWRYKKKDIKHFKGGLTPDLEDEIVMARPPHDDLEDALCGAVEICKPPSARRGRNRVMRENIIIASDRFGGRRIVR